MIPAYLGPCPSGLTAGKKLGLLSFWEALPSQDLWKKEAQELRGRSRMAPASSSWEIFPGEGLGLQGICRNSKPSLLKSFLASLCSRLPGH